MSGPGNPDRRADADLDFALRKLARCLDDAHVVIGRPVHRLGPAAAGPAQQKKGWVETMVCVFTVPVAVAPSAVEPGCAFICEHCGGVFGDPWYCGPAGHVTRIDGWMYRSDRICVECFFDAHIPRGYVRREGYVNGIATRRPPVGIGWLDETLAGRASAIPADPRFSCHTPVSDEQ